MAYSFKPDDPGLGDGLRRIAADQLDRAIAALEHDDLDSLHARVHDARKRCKKLRGLARLVRPGFDGYDAVNTGLRDAARRLSSFRDRTAILDTYDALARHLVGSDRAAVAPLRRGLTLARKASVRAPDLPDRITAMRDNLVALRAGTDGWRVDGAADEVVAGGIAKTYRRARKAMEMAADTRDPHDLHDWRKRVKYHWYHARLCRHAWQDQMDPHCAAADALSDLLGDHHDIVAFRSVLGDPALPGRARTMLAPVAEARAARLERQAIGAGAYLMAEKPKALTRRWMAWWRLSDLPA